MHCTWQAPIFIVMQKLIEDVRSLGGAARRQHLLSLGHSKHQIANAIEQGLLRSPSRLWVMMPDAPISLRTALVYRGLVGGAAALETYGVWVLDTGKTVVAVKPNSHVEQLPAEVARVQGHFAVDPNAPWRVSLLDALLQYCTRASKYAAIAAVDSALHQRLLTPADLAELRIRLPGRCRGWLDCVDGRAESGLESIVRVACLEQGWSVEVQVRFRGGRLDLVVNGWLCIELDGSRYHDEGRQVGLDRQRNKQLVAAGMRWHRFGYADVVFHLDETIGIIRKLLLQGRPVA